MRDNPASIKRLLYGFFAIIIFGIVGSGCAGHIRPRPNYTWPEMADSKIPGKLAIYVPPELAGKSIKTDPAAPCCPHKNLLIGKGVIEATKEACLAVFKEATIFKEKPDEEYLKKNDFRGLLILDSLKTNLKMPTITGQGNSAIVSDISIRISMNFRALDLLIKQDSLRVITPDGEGGKKMNSSELKNINKIIANISDRTLKESGAYLAQMLANIYGAR